LGYLLILLIPLIIAYLCNVIPKIKNSHPQRRYVISAVFTALLFLSLITHTRTEGDTIAAVLAALFAALLLLIVYRRELRRYLSRKNGTKNVK
jgi:phosphate starvation-inducible membrane PsiE